MIQDVTETEIFFFNKNILSSYEDKDKRKEENIKSIIRHLNEGNVNSKEIMSRHWLYIYTIESDFYKKLNKSLRKKDNNHFLYNPFVKICYEGIRKEILNSSKKELYRGTLISKKEIENLREKVKKKLEEKKEYPKVIVYSRCFLSFSEDISAG